MPLGTTNRPPIMARESRRLTPAHPKERTSRAAMNRR